MIKNNQIKPKVLFYTGNPRAFRTTSIGNLYEISQVWPVVLLSEKLDLETEKILKNKKLFPKLEKIIEVCQFSGKKMNLFSENIYLYKLARNIIEKHKPNLVIFPTDTYLFDFYLMRFAKKIKAINIILNSDHRLAPAKEISLRVDLTNAYFKLPAFLPFNLRFLLIKIRKYLGYFLYNWILPLTVGQAPFFGQASRILYTLSGFRADYRIVCSKEDFELSLKEGIPAEKLVLLNHPLERKITKRFFERIYFSNPKPKTKTKEKSLTLLYPEESYGFKRDDHSLISEKEMVKSRIKMVNLIANTLRGWRIFIKPHPATPQAKELKNIFESISSLITFTNPAEPVDKYIEMSKVVVGLPPVSTVIFTTSLKCPEKPLLSLDLPPQEIFGDLYQDFEGVEYIENEEKFIKILKAIGDNKYHQKSKIKSEPEGFSGTVELLEYLLRSKKLC